MILACSDSRSLPALPLSLLAAASLMVASAGALRAQEADAVAPATLSYRLTTEVNGSPWGEWTIEQGREVAIARWISSEGPGEVALVSGPAVGGLPAEPKEMGLLSTLFDPTAGLGPGSWKASTYGSGTAVVDSLRLELQEGDAHETIVGHGTRHHVLTARLWWRHVSEEGAETPVFEMGAADLWFAPDLPFSWLPLAVHPQTPGLAFPLAHGWPEVAWAIIAEHGERLRSLGLLLRARTRDEIRPSNDPDAITQLAEMEYERSVSVSELASAAGPPDAGPFADLPRLGRGRAALLEVSLFLLEPCGSLESAEGGSFEFIASGPEREVLGGGSGALLLRDAGIEDGYVVVMGVVGEAGAECTVVMMPGAAPRTGTFPVSAPNPGFARPARAVGDGSSEDPVLALHVLADRRGPQRLLVLEEGLVRIDDAGPEGVSGALEGEGWILELHPDYPRRLLEGIRVELTFRAAPAPEAEPVAPGDARHAARDGAEPGDHDGIEPARAEIAAGAATALAEPPPPGPAIALDGFRRSHDLALPDGIRAVAIGPDGSWAAVSPVSGGSVLLLDLEAGKVADELTLGGEHDRVTSLAISSDGGTLAAGGMGVVHVLELPGGGVLHRFEVERPGGGAAEVQALAFAPSGQALVATAGSDLLFFDLRTGERIGSRSADPSGVRRLAWSPDGALLATAGSPVLNVWSTADLAAMESEEPRCAIELEHPLTYVAFSSDGRRLVATDFQANARAWDASTCEPVTAFETGAGFIASFALSPDGGLLITGGDDGTLRAFELASGESRGTLQGDPDSAGVVLSRGGERMLTVSYKNRAITTWERP